MKKRGLCPVCGFSFKLRRDGTVGAHFIYNGAERLRCHGGDGRKPKVVKP